ncbi:hypothetical protein DZF91_10625 [Actinomadura logoneensis]|uniref:Uncharacterized protein n=1 Tax=Actinomadura logoneensis TaxID=2293572 RepID=A0A372JPD7_9ACTN|nr:hypothetical protein DZF91_10625 [Actinomadura logoneensis]
MPEQITFVGHQRPGLPSGDYHITVEQRIDLDPEPFTASRTFSVAGDRFSLPQAAVLSVFPPDGSLGDHSNVLPHIVLKRPSLPWEREPGGTAGSTSPWLALLLFTDAERPRPRTVTRAELTRGTASIPEPAAERLEPSDEKMTVIDVPRSLLAEVLGELSDVRNLPYTAHVRRGEGPDAALVIGGRLPPAGQSCTVHLVSLEGRYDASGQFAYGSAAGDSEVRLVSLYNWRFACADTEQTFATLARKLGRSGAPFRLPRIGDPTAEPFLDQGLVPVRHELLEGGRTVSWYRGPFATGPVDGESVTPVRSPDRLLRYHPDTGMFDVGYASAWQLGRLLTLRSAGIATELYEWKRRRSQHHLREVSSAYPLAVTEIDSSCPAPVATFLNDLSLLRGVPFPYLVPDERLLPTESIRFVTLDTLWLKALIDGAFSIGRLGAADAALDRLHPPPVKYPRTTGVLIRSDLVSGYPDLLIDAYPGARADQPLPVVRRDKLSANIMLCLFRGDIARLDVHQRPESLHFAIEPDGTNRFGKALRNASGGPGPDLALLTYGPRRTIPLRTLADAMADALSIARADFGPGDFARQMIETAERVTYLATGITPA